MEVHGGRKLRGLVTTSVSRRSLIPSFLFCKWVSSLSLSVASPGPFPSCNRTNLHLIFFFFFCFYLFGRQKEPGLALPPASTRDAASPPRAEGWGKRTINQCQTKMCFVVFVF